MVIFVKENKKGTAVIAVGGFLPPLLMWIKRKNLKRKNERREKMRKGKIRSRYSYQLMIVNCGSFR